MRLQNQDIKLFIEFLYDLELAGKASRMRTRFVELLVARFQQINKEHQQLIKEHSNLDEDGNPIIVNVDGQEEFDIKDKKAFTQDFFELMTEEFIIEQSENNKEMLLSVKESVLNCDKPFKGREAALFNHWCEIVEQVNYE